MRGGYSMNILLQIAGFFIMLTIFIFYFIDRKAEVRSNRQFLYFGIAIFISLILDVTSLLFIDYLYNPDLYNIPTIITNIHNRIKKEDNKNNYYSELKLDKDIYNMTTANNYNKNYIYNLINTGLSSYECICGPRKIRDESKINIS